MLNDEIITLATELLESEAGGLKYLRVWRFTDDLEAHNAQIMKQLYAEFSAEFDLVEAALNMEYGDPASMGTEDIDVIPFNGVFRFAIWSVGNKQLFAAVAHEDREVPIFLVLGTAGDDDG